METYDCILTINNIIKVTLFSIYASIEEKKALNQAVQGEVNFNKADFDFEKITFTYQEK